VATPPAHRIVVTAPGQPRAVAGAEQATKAPIQQERRMPLIGVDRIQPRRDQPRKSFDTQAIAMLARSIEQHGLLQPLVVRPHPATDGVYEIIAGERRWRAARAAGVDEVPAIIRRAEDRNVAEVSLIENIQREDLNAIDRAEAYQSYCSTYGVSADELAGRLGENRTTVVNYLRINELSGSIKQHVREGKLEMGHVRCLLGIPTDIGRERLARDAIAGGWSVRATERAVKQWRANRVEPAGGASQSGPGKRPQVVRLEQAFQEAVGTKVTIREGRRKGSGRIIIEYYSLDDFDRIAGKLGVGE